MGQFCEVLHLSPAQVQSLPVAEFDALTDYLARRETAMRKEGS